MMPLYNDISSASGSAAYNLPAPVRAISFRLKPGDDTSCLNLYQPVKPKVLGAPESFLRLGRFAFAETIQPAGNPWLLLNQLPAGGAIPAAADANSIEYVLHKKLGDEVVVDGVRIKLVAALSNSIFQSELIVSDANFIRAFPEQQGFRFFLLEDAPKNLEDALADFGFDVTSTGDRLAQFHRVENTYLATFQSLGAMGLLLGVAGLAAVLLRNAIERRRELALLRATGYSKSDLGWMVLSENLFLLLTGAAFGAVSALMAVTPALQSRGSQFGFGSAVGILIGVILVGTIASLAATRAALRSPLLEALRSE
jgi:putative ABC transport system permease protein